MSLLFLRPPRHRVTCDLIPLAVWKPDVPANVPAVRISVTCDLIPLAVWKLLSLVGVVPAICCRMNLIPLAVLQRKREPFGSLFLCLSPRPASAALSCGANLLPML